MIKCTSLCPNISTVNFTTLTSLVVSVALAAAGKLVEELTLLLCRRKQLSRPALHLLLVPQLRDLSLEKCPGLVTPALCGHIAARCQVEQKSPLSQICSLLFVLKYHSTSCSSPLTYL